MPVVEPRVVSPGFHARVYAVVREVPEGRVTTYGHVAARLGSPRVARHVGFALAALTPDHEPVPWHRVLNARGTISHRDGAEQRRMLEDEGVVFDARGRVDLRQCLYLFPPRGPARQASPKAKAPAKAKQASPVATASPRRKAPTKAKARR